MTLFSFAILGVIAYCVLRGRNIKEIYIYITALAIAIETMTSAGYFLRTGSFELGHSEIVIILDTVIAIIMLCKKQPSKRYFLCGTLLFFSCITSLIMQICFPYKGTVVSSAANWDYYYFNHIEPGVINIGFGHIKEIFHVVCYVIILIPFLSLKEANRKKMLLKVYGFEKIFILYGLVELICVKLLRCQKELLRCVIFIVGDSYISEKPNISIGVGNRLQGINSEPSMYGVALFIFLLLALYLYKEFKERKILIYIFITLSLMISSLAFSAIICLVWFAVFWLLMKYREGNKTIKASILIVFFTGILIALALCYYLYVNDFSNYFLRRIHMALVNLNDLSIDGWSGDFGTYDGSTKIRLVSMVGTLTYFIKRPLFGLALGSTYSHSSFATILASIGLVGTIIWNKFTFFTPKKQRNLIYITVVVLWCALLLISGVGLFQFYGVQNIIIISVFDYFSTPKSQLNKTEKLTKYEKNKKNFCKIIKPY